MLTKIIKIFFEEIFYWLEAIINSIPGKIGVIFRIFLISIIKKEITIIRISNDTFFRNIKNITFSKNNGFGRGSYFDATGGNIIIGMGSVFNQKCHINASVGGTIKIGSNCPIGPNVVMRTANHNFKKKDTPIIEQGHNIANISIGDNCWIGANVTILGGVEIGNSTVIGAGSVVTNSIPSNSLAVGIPAKVIKEI